MRTDQHASNCVWAVPTLFVDAPVWLDAADCPWTCRRRSPRPLESTDECSNCQHWEPVSAEQSTWVDRVPHPLLPDVIARRV